MTLVMCLCLQSFAYRPVKKDWLTRSGDWIQIALPVSTALRLYASDDIPGLRSFSSAALSTWLQTHAIKRWVNATRPYGGKHSFPSGHTSFVFASPSYVAMRYGMNAAMLDAFLASYVGASRIYGRYHFTQDVIAGALLAAANQYVFLQRYGLHLVPAPRGFLLRYQMV